MLYLQFAGLDLLCIDVHNSQLLHKDDTRCKSAEALLSCCKYHTPRLWLQRCGISDGLVRVACGIEATADLIEDFELALASIGGKANALSLGSSNGPALGEVLQNVTGIDEAAQAVEESGLGKAPSDGLSGSPDINVSQLKQNKNVLQQIW